ncbi:multicopper oxidase family protein [Georgenia subflava]|uniref:Multicopper oxidase domain-containing protein n=1 Tax=Georgenia subflava TaxID=1622177 RepID=A0A6N7EIV7_9MICO|nr:multicopper oxidase domain-containing protein [Georgenia subflava]MPV38089.1 multicopper oxidase domain-containing protein [Georgenia subflava]
MRTTTASVRRRGVRLAAGAAVAGLVAAGCGAVPGSISSVDEPAEFSTELTIPPLAESRVEDGVRIFELTAQEGSTSFLPGKESETWGFNGDHLGPTLRAERGEEVAVEVANELDEATSVHWHGMHLPPEMDGGPHQEIEPGGTWRPHWEIDQPGATLWYHPHPHGRTEEHVYRGLAGMFILDDAETASAGLPDEYGVDDVPVIVQDKVIADDGALELDSDGNEVGLLGSTVMVNGTVGAYHDVTTERVRLRLLNGSTARTYAFGFEDRTVQLVATDGGLLRAPVTTDRVRLSPGERAEIVVEMEPGTTARLRSFEPELGAVAAPFAVGANDSFDVLELRAASELAPSEPVASKLAEFGLAESDATVTRTFELDGRKINGQKMDMGRIDEVVEVGSTEIWEVRNVNLSPHNFHVHDVQFEILDIDGEPPPPDLAGRKDTVYLEPRRTYRLIMRFEDYADPTWPYMFHCHLLLHEDEGLMGQFLVVEPGQDPEGPPAGHGGRGGAAHGDSGTSTKDGSGGDSEHVEHGDHRTATDRLADDPRGHDHH